MRDNFAACAYCDATCSATQVPHGWVLDSTCRLACPTCAPGRDLMFPPRDPEPEPETVAPSA